MNFGHVRAVWRKEILDTTRDRRTLLAGVLAPILIMPLLSLGGQAIMNSSQERAMEEKTPVAVIGAAEAPRFVEMLRRSGLFKLVREADPAASLREGRIKLVIRIPRGFERQAMSGAKPAELTVDYQGREMTSSVSLAKLRRVTDAYLTLAQTARLGLADPDVLRAVEVKERNVSTAREMSGMLLGFFLPFTLAIWGIMGGMYTAIDAVAGEKERRTLETLVVAPPSRASLTGGKTLAVLTMSTLTIVLTIGSTFLSFRYGLPLVDRSGTFRLTLDLGAMGLLLLASLPYLAMLAGIQVALSAFGKSFKETQNYFSALMFAVMLPGMALAFMERSFPAWLYVLPFVNVVALFKDIFTGAWQWWELLASAAANLAYFAGTFTLAQRMLADEKLMFKS